LFWNAPHAAPARQPHQMNRTAAWFFDGPSGSSRKEIWRWWEQRRLRYNRDLLILGLVSILLAVTVGSASAPLGEDFVEPAMLLIGPVLYAILANIAYTAGPLCDTLFYRASPRKRFFKLGYIFSLILTALPGISALITWVRSGLQTHR
jgi:hypothetical protein